MIGEAIKYIGVSDCKIKLFEAQYSVPNGMAYNSYVIIDDKIAVMDTVDAAYSKEWLSNLDAVLCGREPDFLVVQHMEPDHSANIGKFTKKYPKTKLVASDKAFKMMQNFFGTDYSERRIVVGDGDRLSLGLHTLNFIAAPMVHWPEVMVCYESCEGVLFSADAFGKFGALEADEAWEDEARRYYIGIVGKYGAQVQALLKKIAGLNIKAIYPLHGPRLEERLEHYIELYNIWSSYQPEKEGVVLAYTSVYGNTEAAVLKLSEALRKRGCENIVINNLARCDMAKAVQDAFRYSKLVLATTTYNNAVFPFMREFICHLTERGFSNRTVALIENGSWAPNAARVMRDMLAAAKNITFAANTVNILSALNDKSEAQLEALAEELSK